MNTATGLPAGAAAPAFTLRDQHGARISLGTFRERRPVILVFFPFAFSGVCTGELRELRTQAARIDEAGAALLAVSCDPMFALRAYADQDGIGFSLLSDFWPHGEVTAAYGVLDTEHGCPTRSTFLIDRAGLVRWQVHNPMGEPRDVGEYFRELAAAQTS